MTDLWGDWASKAVIDPVKAEYFNKCRYALFIHWGLYSVAGSCWKGKTNYAISEWLMRLRNIPAKEYAELAKEFNPVDFNAEKIVSFARECGMKYIVITAKHHEGFAMFRSEHPFNIFDATPWKRDPMKELAEECARQGIGFGFYYSQFQDWAEVNSWEEKEDKLTFEEYFEKKCLPQIRELLTNYGKLALIWFDTPGKMTREQSEKIVELVKTLQPQALINSRIGNGVGDYSTLGDNEFPGTRPGGVWECIATTNDTWGFSSNDKNFRTAKELLSQLVSVASRGGNYMVNIGPDPKGNIPEICEKALRHVGKWVARYGEKMLYGSASSPWETARYWGDCTRKGNKAYFMVKKEAWGKTLTDFDFPGEILEVKWLANGEKLSFEQKGDRFQIELPEKAMEEFFEVLEVSCKEEIPIAAAERLVVSQELPTPLPAFSAKVENAEIKRIFWGERFGEWIYQIVITDWKVGAEAKWELEVLKEGYYQVFLRYQNVDGNNPVWIVENAVDQLEMWSRDVQDLKGDLPERIGRFQSFPAGVMKFVKGKNILYLHPKDREKGMENTQIAEVTLLPFELEE